MRAARTLALMLGATTALALAACAANTEGTQAGEDTFVVPIEIDNNLSGLAGTSIFIARSTGSGRRLLGPIESGQKKTFSYDARPGMYRLTAKSGMRSDSIVSEQFQLFAGTSVNWSLAANRILTGTK